MERVFSRQRSIQRAAGFALPTILIASTVMLIILATAASAVASIRTALNTQYYNQLASEAAEAGYVRVSECLKTSSNVVTWTNSKPLRPNTDCSGTEMFSCSAGSTNVGCYVLMNSRMTSTFAVDAGATEGGMTRFLSSSAVSLMRPGSSSVYRTFQSTLGANTGVGVKQAEAVSSGYLGVCAIFDGATWCWGDNAFGQLGIGYASGTMTKVPSKVHRVAGGLLGKQDKIVTLGTYNACTVTTDNEIYCWGRNTAGQVGNNEWSSDPVTEPVRVQQPAQMQGLEIKELVLGSNHACALAGTDVWCWGDGDYGQLGRNSIYDRYVPTRVWHIGTSNNPALPVTSLASGAWSDTNCAIAGGQSWCWGRDNRGQMGDGQPSVPNGSYTNQLTPWRTPTSGTSSLNGKTLKKIVLSGGFGGQSPDGLLRGHVCALDTSQRVHCWGSDQYGQVGRGFIPSDPYVSDRPYQVNVGLVGGKNIIDVAVSFGTTCVLTDANQLYCWGYNDRGMVGDGTMGGSNSYRTMPVPVALQDPGLLGKTIESITGGANRNCALANSLQYCWGVNTAGQLGDGTWINRPQPTEATMLRQLVPMLYY